MAKSVQSPLQKALENTPAESAQCLEAMKDDVVPKIAGIIAECKEKAEGTMQPTVDQIVKLCLDADLAGKKYIHGGNCGIHPSNRAGPGVAPFNAQALALELPRRGPPETKLENGTNRAGTSVDPFHAQALALKISKQGYSETKLKNPKKGFKKAASAQLQEKQEEFSNKNFEQVGGLLNEIPDHDIVYVPITHSHTFAACSGRMRQQYDDRPTELPTTEKQTEAEFHALVS